MDSQNQYRGRSPSAGNAHRSLNHSRSPSAQAGFNHQASAHGADPTLLQSGAHTQSQHAPSHTFHDSSFLTSDFSQNYPQTSNPTQQSFDQFPVTSAESQFTNTYEDPNGLSPQSDFSASVNPQYLDATNINTNQGLQDFYAQTPTLNAQQEEYGLLQDMQKSYNTVQNPQGHSYSGSLSHTYEQPQAFQQGTRSRGQSLSPSSAAVLPGQAAQEWGGIAFQGHRRNPSADAYSDMSSHHSPFIDAGEGFDQASGILPNPNGQTDTSFVNDSLGGLGNFTISDPNMIHSQHASPGHSNHVSPHMSPQQNMSFEAGDQFGILNADPGPQMYENIAPGIEEFPNNGQFNSAPIEAGINNDVETPQINIELAGPERQPTWNESGGKQEAGMDALSPPSRSPSRQRGRAISDPYSSANMSRSSTPGRQRAPSLGLHPGVASSRSSRSSSPSGPPNGIQKPRDRASSTPSLPAQRDYVLGLADPERQPSPNSSTTGLASSGNESSGGRGRGQKHPATFQCHMCPKRFTRAYNLRSHLRTHTDERPFVCTVCGKAFARQHDRKRHEGLHSGEKKFVCKGTLSSGSPWGCGRRFARADALGRHFRSEAGRACIKPLLEEEARERRAAMMEQANQEAMQHQQQVGMQQPAQMGFDPNAGAVDMSGMTLPAALLAQYPALAGIQWDALPPAGSGQLDVDEGDFDDFGASGRSSYDASSGGELDFEDDASFDPSVMGGGPVWNQPNMSNPQMGQAPHMMQQGQQWTGGY